MKKWSVVAILGLAQFVMVLDSTVMNVSISTVVADLSTTVNGMQAAITFYTLTMAAFMLIGAKMCAKLGLLKAFVIGSLIYGAGSLITGLSQDLGMLMVGWSLIEGLGAVLVIPAIASLIAVNYSGKERVTAYALIGGISGAAAAAGPLIGGFMTTYLSWRYVFIAETVIMLIVLLLSRSFKATAPTTTEKIDIPSALLSSFGMAILVFGMLQSKVWGWVTPITVPVINGREIAPLGVSIVAYMLLLGGILLWIFYNRQGDLEKAGKNPLVHASLFKIDRLRSGLAVLSSQYMITGAIFFVVPIYLQMIWGLDALETGIKILPLSAALIIFSVLGSKLVAFRTPRWIIRAGQILLVIGSVFLLAAVNKDLTGVPFGMAMFGLGAGLGLLASQIGNINMSSVGPDKSSEVGGLQGTFQNFGSSLGTALIGSILVATLTTGFLNSVTASDLPSTTKTAIQSNVKSAQIVPASDVATYAVDQGVSQQEADQIADIYKDAQLQGLKEALFFLIVISVLSILLSRNIPNKVIAK